MWIGSFTKRRGLIGYGIALRMSFNATKKKGTPQVRALGDTVILSVHGREMTTHSDPKESVGKITLQKTW